MTALCEKSIFACNDCGATRVYGCGPYLGPGAEWEPKIATSKSGAVHTFTKGDTNYRPLIGCAVCKKPTRHFFVAVEFLSVVRAFPVRATGVQYAEAVKHV